MFLQGFIEVSEKDCNPIQLSTFKYEILLLVIISWFC